MSESDTPETEPRVVEARTHGRYLVRPPATETPATAIVVGCHGYGENATRHMAELATIPGAERAALVSVDALNAFYDRKSGEVVRGWMTKELRELAIADNVDYLRAILDEVRPRFGWRLPLLFLGFSQGVAMAWRAAVAAGHGAAAMVALAGDVPPELLRMPAEVPFPRRVLLARGSLDDWYSETKMAEDVAALAARGVRAETLVFEGGHVWSDPFRAATGQLLSELSGAPGGGPDEASPPNERGA